MQRTRLERRTGMPPRVKPMPRMSKRRRRERPIRRRVEAEVLERDAVCCFPGCNAPSVQVHELQRGQMRVATYLDKRKCRGLCAEHHRFVTDNPEEGHRLGLVYWSWEDPLAPLHAIHADDEGTGGSLDPAQPGDNVAGWVA
jgi:hypothetical protein